jgi:two-component system, chemotaxis family, protein-glutamate methylesterase/glutaminase
MPADDPLRVVIVDDNEKTRAEYQRYCEELPGIAVAATAPNGADAIRQVKAKQPDLVLMDLVMPDIDGLTAIRMLCRGIPGTRVIVISSRGAESQEAGEARQFGAVDVLSKPITRDDLGRLFAHERELRAQRTSAGRGES